MLLNDTAQPENYDIHDDDLLALQKRIGYQFKDINLLIKALTHKSFANEIPLDDTFGNERLEFLGDAALGLVVSDILMDHDKNCAEGKLSSMRAAIVNEEALSGLAQSYQLGPCILLSRGEAESGGRLKPSILSNVYEALIAAIYYDSGYEAMYTVVESHMRPLIKEIVEKGFYRDYKSRLQEYSQRVLNRLPHYELIIEEGPDHQKFYETAVVIGGVMYEKGQGKSKKASEQDAARKTLNFLTDRQE